MKTDKKEAVRELENKVNGITEVKIEIQERLKNQSIRLYDTLEDNMKLKVELEKTELKQSEKKQLLKQHVSIQKVQSVEWSNKF